MRPLAPTTPRLTPPRCVSLAQELRQVSRLRLLLPRAKQLLVLDRKPEPLPDLLEQQPADKLDELAHRGTVPCPGPCPAFLKEAHFLFAQNRSTMCQSTQADLQFTSEEQRSRSSCCN